MEDGGFNGGKSNVSLFILERYYDLENSIFSFLVNFLRVMVFILKY